VPDITMPHTFTGAPVGDTTSASKISDNIYSNKALPESMEVINGRLDAFNLDAATTIERTVVRRRTFSEGRTVGGTVNLDYFDDLWTGDWDGTSYNAAKARGVPVAGLGLRYYLPHDMSALYISWAVDVVSDGDLKTIALGGANPTPPAAPSMLPRGNNWYHLTVDGVDIAYVRRSLGDGVHSLTYHTSSVLNTFANSFTADSKRWYGGYMLGAIEAAAHGYAGGEEPYLRGWHNAYITVSSKAKQTRIRTRRITVIGLK